MNVKETNLELPLRLLDWINESKLDWIGISGNPSPNAIQMLKKNPDKIYWNWLSGNSSFDAIQILKENPEKINWDYLSGNSSLDAIQMLTTNQEKINWPILSGNPGAIKLLQANPEKIVWKGLSENHHIFTYNYDKMRTNMLLFKEDLMKERFHPRNLRKFSSWGHSGGIDEEDDE